jgi:hypothetical protein
VKSTGDHGMSKFFVRSVETEPRVKDISETDLFGNLKKDENIINCFPFDDLERKSLEIYKIGSEKECQDYIDKINVRIKHLFKIEEFAEEDYSNPLINFK